jgi:flagellar basal body-associated protein FliL
MSTYNSLAAGKGFGEGGTTARKSSGGGLIILILVIVVIALGYMLYKEKKRNGKSHDAKAQNRK